MERKEVVFVLGGPGSGKGTQCAKIVSEFGYTHLSTGDLLREEQKKESDMATEIADCIRNGKLVAASIMVTLLKAAILNSVSKRFLVDGFPRSKDNLATWLNAFSDDEVQVPFVLFLNCPKDELKKRLLERGQTSGRADDNMETVLKRFHTFEKESMPVVGQLQQLGMVREVSSIPAQELVSHHVLRIFRGGQLVDPVERTLVLIKPDAVASGKTDDIVARAEKEGFLVVGRIESRTWAKADAEAFYAEHRGKPFFDNLVAFMSSGPIVQLCLEKVDAIKAWRKLAGPTNAAAAKKSEPSSLRALHGTDGTKNAVHGSDSFMSALREVNFCFNPSAEAAAQASASVEAPGGGGTNEGTTGYGPDGFAKEEKTLALLKPGVSELDSDLILSVLAFRGFTVHESTTKVMKEGEVRDFYKARSGEPQFQELCASLAERGETTALCVSRVKGVASLRSLIGPADLKTKELFSRSWRAMYGQDKANDAVHASESLDSAARELSFWFPRSSGEHSNERSSAGRAAAAREDPKYDEMMAYMKETVDPVISPLLQRVLKARPRDVASFAIQDLQQLALTEPSRGASLAS